MGKEIDGRTGKNEDDPSKIVGSQTQNEERREKSGLHRAKKRAHILEKSPEIGFETGKSAKNGDFGAKKEGWGEVKKWALLPILPCYEVAKWAQMKFSRIFFR